MQSVSAKRDCARTVPCIDALLPNRWLIVNACERRLGSRAGPQENKKEGQKKGGGPGKGFSGGVRGGVRPKSGMGKRVRLGGDRNPCQLVPNASRQEAEVNCWC